MTFNKSIPAKRILVIDDNAAIHEDFCKILMKTQALDDSFLEMESALFGAGIQTRMPISFEIDSAFQGREGFDLLQKAKSEDRPYAMAFVDGRMPPGWDGIETIAHLWKECPDLQVVLCTAYADYSWQEICRVLGETDNLLILKKPFDNVEVLQMVHSLTRKWELSREVQYRIENLDDMVQRKTEEKDHLGSLLKTALDHSPAGMIISDVKDVAIRWANPSASHILGNLHLFSPVNPRIIHDTDWQAFQPNGKTYTPEDMPLFRATVKGEIIQNEEFIIRNALGQEKWISSNAAPVLDSNGYISAGILIFEDITGRKQAEEEKEKLQAEKLEAFSMAAETEKLALVGQIAGKMAHDFNNILGAIMGNSELALMDCSDTQTREKLELILDQTIRGKNLTRNLVAFARDQEPKQEFFSISEKIELVTNLLKKDLEGIHLVREYSPGIPEILADPGMIEHAVVNLIQNSIHSLSLNQDPEIIVRTGYQDEHIIIDIEDNGCGIPEKFLEKIFLPSFTLKGSSDKGGMYKSSIKGTGYGMSNVKKYIDQHGGTISIHSQLQKGTKVTITLPIRKKALTEKEILTVKKNNICSDRYILLVEDEATISEVQYTILTHAPCRHRVDIAKNGLIALELLNKNKYDAISLDYMLPGKINGMDVYHHIRKTNNNVPILFISGNIEFLESIKELKQKDLHVGHLSKPCKNIDYVNGINKLLGLG